MFIAAFCRVLLRVQASLSSAGLLWQINAEGAGLSFGLENLGEERFAAADVEYVDTSSCQWLGLQWISWGKWPVLEKSPRSV